MKRKNFLKITGLGITGLIVGSGSKGSSADFQNPLPPVLTNAQGPIHNLTGWEKQKDVIIRQWSDYLGIIPPNPYPPRLRTIEEDRPGGIIRQLIEYENEPGMTVRAYLIKPQKIQKSLPGVVALHSTSDNQMLFISGVEKGSITPMAAELAGKGFVVICPMCFLWQDKGSRTYEQQVERFHMKHPGSKGMARMLYDAQRAVDVLVSLKEVDSERLGAMGHSLGGKEAFYLGAFDKRVKVIVSNEGGIGIDFSNWDDIWYLGKEIHEFRHQHHELLALCAPKPFLLIGGEDADGQKSLAYIEAVLPVYDLYGKSKNLKFFNHAQGHNITPEAEKMTYEWLIEHL